MTSNVGRSVCCGIAVLFLAHGMAKAQVAVRIPDEEIDVTSLVVVDTSRRGPGTGRAGADQPASSKEVWLGSGDLIYRIDEELLVSQVWEGPRGLQSLAADRRHVWVSAADGVFRISIESGRRERIEMPRVPIRAAAGGEHETYLQTDSGVYMVGDDRTDPLPVTGLPPNVNAMARLHNRIFFAGIGGVYELEVGQSNAGLIPGSPAEVIHMISLNGRLWLVDHKGIMSSAQGREFTPVPGSPAGRIKRLQGSNGTLLFWTKEGVYTVGLTRPESPEAAQEYRVRGIADLRAPDLRAAGLNADDVEFVQYQGSEEFAGGEFDPHLFQQRKDITTASYVYAGDLWLGTGKGLYHRKNATTRHVLNAELNVKGMALTGSSLWVMTNHGAYIVDPDWKITVDITTEESWWKYVAERTWFIRVSGTVSPELKYEKTGFNNFFSIRRESLPADKLMVFMEMNKADFGTPQGRNSDEYALPKNMLRKLEGGFCTRLVHYSVRDKWNNTFDGSMAVFVVPGPVVTTLLLGSLWPLSLLAIIYLAPRNATCQQLLMNKRIRTWGYLNLAPLIITLVPAVQRHVLRRYLDSVNADSDFKDSAGNYVLPSDEFSPEHFLGLLKEHKSCTCWGSRASVKRLTVSSSSDASRPTASGGAPTARCPSSCRWYATKAASPTSC